MSTFARRKLDLLRNLVLSRGDLSLRALPHHAFNEREMLTLQRQQIDSLYYLTLDASSPIQLLYHEVWKSQRRAFIDFRDKAVELGLEPILYKGAACFEQYCNGSCIGMFNTIDVFIPSSDVALAKSALRKLGFSQSEFDAETKQLIPIDAELVADYEARRNELPTFVKQLPFTPPSDDALPLHVRQFPLWFDGQDASIFICFNIQLAPPSDSPNSLGTRNPRRLPSGCLAVDATNHLWLLMLRYYRGIALERRRSLRDIAYMLLILLKDVVDWPRLAEMTEQYDVRSAMYYGFHFLRGLGCQPDPHLLEMLDLRKGSRDFDLGWQYSKLFGQIDQLSLPE